MSLTDALPLLKRGSLFLRVCFFKESSLKQKFRKKDQFRTVEEKTKGDGGERKQVLHLLIMKVIFNVFKAGQVVSIPKALVLPVCHGDWCT